MTATTVSFTNMVNSIRGALGTTGVGSLYDRGQDFRYTTLSINSPYVSISPTGVYGDPTYAASFNSVGTTNTKPIYGGDYRLAAGGTFNVGPGANRYIRSFETYDTCPTAGTVIVEYCIGTTFVEQLANGTCGINTITSQVVGKCGYAPTPPPPPPAIPPGRIAIFTTNSSPLPIGGALIAWTDGPTGGNRSTSIGRGYNRSHCIDPNETKWNQGYYDVDYYPNQHGVITLSVNVTSTPCS
tara:strand:- start:99 stop:821 length:723 start_codon:yes stop_codon:yes gene_type:complete